MGEVLVSDAGGGAMEMEKKGGGDGGGGSSSAAAAAAAGVVRWERFLPKMVLRVLLVEADDSTRQIITALLRKCSYRVAAVSDGLKAWEVLKGRPHNIDLILTEVDLPSISGFALLTLIMEHEICKNIPVIMMSSQDSVSTVYKCMLRGAADFLVKPVRKNELRNLWQHVWRKQAATSGGPGPPDERVVQQKLEATAENNAVSNSSSGYVACIDRNRECIEKGSDAQSSCAKPEMDTDEAETECLQSVLQTKTSKSISTDITARQKEGGHGLIAREDFQPQGTNAAASRTSAGTVCQTTNQQEGIRVDDHWQHGTSSIRTPDSNHLLARPFKEAIDLNQAFDTRVKYTHGSSASDIGPGKTDSSPVVELSLQRSHPSSSVNQGSDHRHKLNHSDASAFSRYVYRAVQPRESSSGTSKPFTSHMLDHPPGSLAQVQPGQAETAFSSPQQRASLPAPVPVRGIRFENTSNSYGGPMMPPIFCLQPPPLSPMQSPGSFQRHEPPYKVHTFFPPSQPARNLQPYNTSPPMVHITSDATEHSENRQEHRLEMLENDRNNNPSPADQSACSSFCTGTASQFRSISDDNNGRANPVMNLASESGKDEAFPTHDGNSHRSMQREAALNKFRLKRKERCYGKKVRYESRKKLAEQRPRVKGQFVRQAHNNDPPSAGSS